MNAEEEVSESKSSGGPSEGTPHRSDKGVGPEHRILASGVALMSPRGDVWWKSEVLRRTERKRSAVKRVTEGELVSGSEAQYPSEGARSGDGTGVKFCVLTQRDLSASAGGR
jgi:hypothetical protein